MGLLFAYYPVFISLSDSHGGLAMQAHILYIQKLFALTLVCQVAIFFMVRLTGSACNRS